MNIDIISSVIFGLSAILVFNKSFSAKTTVALAILTTILTHFVIKMYAFLPFIITGTQTPMPLLDHNEIIVILLQIPVSIVVYLLIRKDDDNLFRFTLLVIIGMFLNYMLIPFLLFS